MDVFEGHLVGSVSKLENSDGFKFQVGRYSLCMLSRETPTSRRERSLRTLTLWIRPRPRFGELEIVDRVVSHVQENVPDCLGELPLLNFGGGVTPESTERLEVNISHTVREDVRLRTVESICTLLREAHLALRDGTQPDGVRCFIPECVID